MSNLIDRYVYDVTRRLPEKDREEVKKELTANILDMLPDDFNEQDVATVLQSLGSPLKMAEQYRMNPRYLISPANFDNYLTVLKLVVSIVAAVAMLAGLLAGLLEFPQNASMQVLFTTVFQSMIEGLVSGAMGAAIWVTIIFAVLDYAHVKKGEKSWAVSDLPDIPVHKKSKISRREAIAGIIFSIPFSVFFIVIFAFYPNLIGWYEVGKPIIPLFNSDALTPFIPFIILFPAFSLLILVVKLIYGRWSLPILLLTIFFRLANAVFAILFITTDHLFNRDFLARFAESAGKSLDEITGQWNYAIQITIGMILFFTALGILTSLRRAFRGQKSGSILNRG